MNFPINQDDLQLISNTLTSKKLDTIRRKISSIKFILNASNKSLLVDDCSILKAIKNEMTFVIGVIEEVEEIQRGFKGDE